MNEWMSKASCKNVDQDIFFPDYESQRENIQRQAQAKTICRKCPVAAECLMYAISNKEKYGVWGSFSARERSIIAGLFSDRNIDVDICKSLVNKEVKSIKLRMSRMDLNI